ncbi:site-specific DNA-methyltransferase [Acinetobacter sp. VNK23]|uniref:site-specific DNA-methyltransferase n=1 Tax=Acinetobacter thutiue TaxID=2998078 RepID=UPI002576A05C|nr:site-specific DNA-methyltransferase [Acinetobacter thutiue]MDM1018885.1 site-specific DNA-methyltransferase [Acinetobacter thutiue]
MSDQLKMHSPNLVDSNIEKIAALFPNCVTEAQGENGELKKAIDFDLLKQELSQVIVEGEQERYRLDWVGKKESILTANAPIAKTLRPCREESVNFDTTENLFIEGDNLEALKLLQENYLGKVKMIYIDPPYNTGKDFIYSDNFAESTDEFLERSYQVDKDGNCLVANTDSNGRFHSDWLSMMYSRLKLSRNLLKNDGLIFISIGDDEVENLRKICDEIFGAHNFCAKLIWNTEGNTDNQYKIKVNHEYILVFYKDKNFDEYAIGHVIDPNTPQDSNLRKGYADNNINKNNPENPPSIVELPIGFPCSENELFYEAKELDEEFYKITQEEKFISDEVKEKYGLESKSGLPVKLDNMVVKNGKLVQPCRIYVGMANKNKLLEFIKNDNQEILDNDSPLSFYINSNAAVRYRKKVEKPRNILSVIRGLGTTEKSKTYLRKLGVFYDYPKPVGLIEYLLEIGCENDEIVLDFFAGSSTTAEAIFNSNLKSKKHRKFILVQIPELLDSTRKEQKSGYKFCIQKNVVPAVTEISKERIRLAGTKIIEENKGTESIENLDIGFRVLKIDSTNMKDVYYTPDAYKQVDILDLADHIKEDRTSEDLLFQVMLDWGLELSLPIEQKIIQGKEVFYVAGNSLVACFDEINFAMVDEIAQDKPLRVVSAERAIQLDHDKTNIKERFKQLSPETEVKFI